MRLLWAFQISMYNILAMKIGHATGNLFGPVYEHRGTNIPSTMQNLK